MNFTKMSLFAAAAVALSAPAAFAQTAQLHVVDDVAPQVYVQRTGDASAGILFKLENQGNVRFEMRRGGVSWTFDNRGNAFTILRAGNPVAREFELDDQGNLTVAGTVSSGSSKAIKTDFENVDEQAMLEKVAALPVTSWRYKTAPESERHVGPMAEDFHEAFGTIDAKSISMVDANGVAIAAIKGLNTKLENELAAKNAEIARLQQSNDEFAERLAKLEEKLGARDDRLASR